MSVQVSIIICTCNRADHLRQTMDAIQQVDVPAGGCELIVVDNASTDGTADVVNSCGLSNMPVRYVLEPRRGKMIVVALSLQYERHNVVPLTLRHYLKPYRYTRHGLRKINQD